MEFAFNYPQRHVLLHLRGGALGPASGALGADPKVSAKRRKVLEITAQRDRNLDSIRCLSRGPDRLL